MITGSIVITFDLYPSSSSGSDTLGQMLWTIENMVESGTLTLTNPDGDVLPVNVTSFSYTEQSPSTSDGDDGKPGKHKVSSPNSYMFLEQCIF